MKKSEIEKIKQYGAKQHLREKLNSTLWGIRAAAENATKEYYKDYLKEMAKIRKLADDADALWKEAFK